MGLSLSTSLFGNIFKVCQLKFYLQNLNDLKTLKFCLSFKLLNICKVSFQYNYGNQLSNFVTANQLIHLLSEFYLNQCQSNDILKNIFHSKIKVNLLI